MRFISLRACAFAVAAIGFACSAQPAKAAFFTGTSGDLSASVDFQVTGPNTLTVVLTNTAGVNVGDPAGVLTAVYVNYGGGANHLSVVGGTAIAAGTANFGGATNVNVGGEWAYKENINVQNNDAFKFGISSTGLGIFGEPELFGGPNITGPDAPDGPQWGIMNSGYVDGSGNGGVNGTPFAKNSVTFTLTVTDDFDLSLISGVRFQYGTALTEPSFGGGGGGNAVPAPAGLILLATALPVFALRRVIRRKPAAA